MRILVYTNQPRSNFSKELLELKEKYKIQIDFTNDYEEAEYCAYIRKYETIFIDMNDKIKAPSLNLFKAVRSDEVYTKIVVSSLKDDTFFKKYNLDIHMEDSWSIELVEDTLNLENIIETEYIKVNVSEKTVWVKKEDEYIQIKFKKKIDFYVFLYFMRHYKETLHMSRILNATCQEPEIVKNSIIDSSISSLRKMFLNMLNIENSITSFKKIGYEFSLEDPVFAQQKTA